MSNPSQRPAVPKPHDPRINRAKPDPADEVARDRARREEDSDDAAGQEKPEPPEPPEPFSGSQH